VGSPRQAFSPAWGIEKTNVGLSRERGDSLVAVDTSEYLAFPTSDRVGATESFFGVADIDGAAVLRLVTIVFAN
jgi:hypothetical protein